MELSNEIEVNAPIEEVWNAFNTPERIAPCLPGAELQEVEGDNFKGAVKIKVGPITAQYKDGPTVPSGRGLPGNAPGTMTE